jgi:hypothetical protein
MVAFKPSFASVILAVSLAVSTIPAEAQQIRRQEQNSLRENVRKGAVQSLSQIEANIVPAMKRRGAEYIGASFDPPTLRYRLKFVRQASVIWIDVDGRSGAILAKAGD